MPETALAEYQQPKHPGGKPPFYPDPEQLSEAIDSYFDWCQVQQQPPTKVGLALHLGFCSRQSLQDYKVRSNNPEYAYCIKRAEAKIEQYLAQRVILGKGSTPGTIFTLKAMHGWQETQSIQVDVNQTVSVPQLEQAIRGLLSQATPEQLEGLGIIDVEPELIPAGHTRDQADKGD
jgi:hypothetical protein